METNLETLDTDTEETLELAPARTFAYGFDGARDSSEDLPIIFGTAL